MTSNSKKIIYPLISLAFWLLVWQVAAVAVDHQYFLPDIPTTLSALANVVTGKDFLLSVLYTFTRVLTGLTLGTLIGIAIAVLTHKSEVLHSIIAPALSVIKATPVATIIIILWVTLDGNSLAITVSFLMVMPIIWQNMSEGLRKIDKSLIEVSDVFELTLKERAKILIFPSLLRYFIPAFITSVGFAWKSEIAAEIIANTRDSIGHGINGAKQEFNSPEVFAWTLIIVLFSIALEWVLKKLLKRYDKL